MTCWTHPQFGRRTFLEAGAVSVLGLGMNHLQALRAESPDSVSEGRSVIFVFLSGGIGQHDSFDLKPEAPDNIRGEFQPIDTRTPGMRICEHLPRLAQCSQLWSLCRSLTHPYNEHSQGHMVMLSGRTPMPPTFRADRPTNLDWPSIASIVGAVCPPRNNLPPAAVLPERLIHRTGRVIPGQFAGVMGRQRDPWFIEAAPFNGTTYGAFPEYEFHHARGPENRDGLKFEAPNLSLPEALSRSRLDRRLSLLDVVETQRRELERAASMQDFDRHRQAAISLLTESRIRSAFDVQSAPADQQDRYGRNSFGWSLLMARKLVAAGVSMVQVNLGNNETWDTHGNAFPNLKNQLLPPFDQGLAALLADLHESGQLSNTLVVVAGEFGRTPKILGLPQHYKLPGRDHWGAVQSILLAGGGVQGGRVVGSSDRLGAYPEADPQTPENFAATIYRSLGLPDTVAWTDDVDRPHHIYHGEPINALF